jgi:hypothetical protein
MSGTVYAMFRTFWRMSGNAPAASSEFASKGYSFTSPRPSRSFKRKQGGRTPRPTPNDRATTRAKTAEGPLLQSTYRDRRKPGAKLHSIRKSQVTNAEFTEVGSNLLLLEYNTAKTPAEKQAVLDHYGTTRMQVSRAGQKMLETGGVRGEMRNQSDARKSWSPKHEDLLLQLIRQNRYLSKTHLCRRIRWKHPDHSTMHPRYFGRSTVERAYERLVDRRQSVVASCGSDSDERKLDRLTRCRLILDNWGKTADCDEKYFEIPGYACKITVLKSEVGVIDDLLLPFTNKHVGHKKHIPKMMFEMAVCPPTRNADGSGWEVTAGGVELNGMRLLRRDDDRGGAARRAPDVRNGEVLPLDPQRHQEGDLRRLRRE